MPAPPARCDAPTLFELLRAAVCIGIAAGFGEVLIHLALRQLYWLSWQSTLTQASPELLAVAPLATATAYALVVAAAYPCVRAVAPRRLAATCAFVLAFMAAYTWLAIGLAGRLETYALLAMAAGLATAAARLVHARPGAALGVVRRALPWGLAACVLATIGVPSGLWLRERLLIASLDAPPANAPNLIVIVVDTLRADHLSSSGYPRQTTPAIDALAREGVTFEHAIAASSWTLPSHASLLTGLYPRDHGATGPTGRERVLRADLPNLAVELQARGYLTGAFSANQIFFTRNEGFTTGFIRFEDYSADALDTLGRTFVGQRLHSFVLGRLPRPIALVRARTADAITLSVLDWMTVAGDRPYFAFVNYFDAHGPELPPEPWRDKFASRPAPFGDLDVLRFRYDRKLSPQQQQYIVDTYDGGIAYVDHGIAAIARAVKRSTHGRQTLVVVTSDHGEMLGEHGYFDHGVSLYLGETHVPLVLWLPDRLPAGRRIDTPVSTASLAATVLDLVGDRERPFALPSLMPLVRGEAPAGSWPHPQSHLRDSPTERTKLGRGRVFSIVTDRWLYLEEAPRPPQLFEWRKDRHQKRDLAATTAGRGIVARLRTSLHKSPPPPGRAARDAQ